MAKKSRRTPQLSDAQLYRPGAKADAVVETPVTTAVSEETLAEEYRYVLTDLKKIAWLALVMLGLLIALAFVLV